MRRLWPKPGESGERDEEALAKVLNELYADGATRFVVTNPSSGVFYVEFTGELAKWAQPLLGVEMFSQNRGASPNARLPVTAEVLTGLELNGAPNAQMTFEIAAWDAQGSKTVLAHTQTTVINGSNGAIA